MDIYIYGAGQRGHALRERIERSDADINIKGFIDRNPDKEGVVSLETVDKKDNIVISLAKESVVYQVAEMLENRGYENLFYCDVLDSPVYSAEKFLYNDCLCVKNREFPVLKQAETHLSDKCNLNCVGCAHYSPIFDEIGAEYEQKIQDIKRFSELGIFIHRFYLLGGEPFLNPEIDRYIVGARQLLPETDLQIVTNGLLLLSVKEEVLQSVADNNVTLSITEYEPMHDAMAKIEKRLQEYKIKYFIRRYEKEKKFNKPLTINSEGDRPKLCISNGCINIWNGKIARCPAVMYIDKFNEVFETNLPNEGVYDLDDVPRGEALLRLLEEDIPLCRYCVENPIRWDRCGKEHRLEDFATRD